MNLLNNQVKWWQNPTLYYFQQLFKNKKIEEKDEKEDILTEEKQAALQKIKKDLIIWAAIYGACGVVFLYIPFYLFPFLFPFYNMEIIGWVVPFSPIFTIYGLILAIWEIIALTILNLKMVVNVSKICNFPNYQNKDFDKKIQVLYEVSIEKQSKELLDFDINPLEGLSKWQITFYTTLNKIKATLGNIIIKVILGRIFGRFLLRYSILKYFIDFVSLPIFAFWDAYTSYKVFRETKVRVLAPNVVRHFVLDFKRNFYNDEAFKAVLLDSLRFIAIAKRSFHHNHYLLAENIVHHFDLVIDKNRQKLNLEELLYLIETLNLEQRLALAKLFVLGMLIDGQLSRRDWNVLRILDKKDMIINFDYKTLKKWEHNFTQGKGLTELLQSKLQ